MEERFIFNENKRSKSPIAVFQKIREKACHTVHAQDGKWAWLVCMCGVLCNIIAFGYIYSFGVLYPTLLKEFGESKATTALVGSLGMAFVYAFSPITAKLYDRFGARKITILGALFCLVGLACSSPVKSLPILFFTYSVLTGFGACCVQTAVYLVVPRYFKKRATLALGLVATGPGAGLLVFSTLLSWCLDTVGLRSAYLVMAGCAGAIVLLGSSFDGNIKNSHADREEELLDPIGAKTVMVTVDTATPITRNYPFLIFILMTGVAESSDSIVLIHLAKFSQSMGLTKKESDTLFQVVGLTSMVAYVACGWLIDKFRVVTPLRCFRISLLVIGISVTLCPVGASFLTLVVFSVFFGIFYGVMCLAFYAYVFNIVPLEQRSKAFGFGTLAASVGFAVGPPFAGFLVDLLHSYPYVFYVAGSIKVFAFIASFLIELCRPSTIYTGQETTAALEAYHELLVVEKITVL